MVLVSTTTTLSYTTYCSLSQPRFMRQLALVITVWLGLWDCLAQPLYARDSCLNVPLHRSIEELRDELAAACCTKAVGHSMPGAAPGFTKDLRCADFFYFYIQPMPFTQQTRGVELQDSGGHS